MFGPFYDNLLQQIELLRRLSAEFRVAHEQADTKDMKHVSSRAASIMNDLALEARNFKEREGHADTSATVGRLAEKGVGHDDWENAKDKRRLPETLETGPMSLQIALHKRVHALAGSYRLDKDRHVLLSYGTTQNGRRWIAEWTVEAFCDEIEKLIIDTAKSSALAHS